MGVRTPRRGRSSRTSEEAENDQPKEPEKLEETLSRGRRRSGAVTDETSTGRILNFKVAMI